MSNNSKDTAIIRRHSAIMFTDIVGYTALMGSDEEKAFEILSKNKEIHIELIKKHDGKLIKEMGDGMLISFDLASDAVYCAIQIQLKCNEEGIPLKIGIHEGETVITGPDVFGDAVNIASRLEADSHQGCIYVSGTVYRNIKNRRDIRTKFIKAKKFKNVDESIRVYEVLCDTSFDQHSINKKHVEKLLNKKSLIFMIVFLVVVGAGYFVWKKSLNYKYSELEKSIAVFPLEYLSEDVNKSYLADGVMDAIGSHLSKIDDLTVIPRTTVEQYRKTAKTSNHIRQELNVAYVLQGSFLLVENQVTLIIQLIAGKENDNLYSEEFTRDYSDILNVQSELAQIIAKEIGVAISPETREVIESIPTSNPSAYDFYLRGNEYLVRSDYEESYRNAIKMYENAVNIDSSFVLAWVGLIRAYKYMYQKNLGDSQEQLKKINNYLEYAKSLSPKSLEVQIEEGSYHYRCTREFEKALNILEPLCQQYPNNIELNEEVGAIYRRLGEFATSYAYNQKLLSSNPSDWENWINIGLTSYLLRNYKEAEKQIRYAIEFYPSLEWAHHFLIEFYANTGQVEKGRDFIQKNQSFGENPYLKLLQAYIEVLDKQYSMAIPIIESIDERPNQAWVYFYGEQGYIYLKHLQLGLMNNYLSNHELAKKHFNLAREYLLECTNNEQQDPQLFSALGIAYAGLGMKKEAIEAGERGLSITNFSNDAWLGFYTELAMAKILLMIGEHQNALTRLEDILKQSGMLTAENLKLDPIWNPLRDMEGFKSIINNPEYQVN